MKKLIPFFLLLIAISCAEESVKMPNDTDFSSRDILSFKDGADAISYYQGLGKETPDGFKSIQSQYQSLIETLGAIEDESTHAKLLDENKDLVNYVDYQYSPVLDDEFYRVICNLDRMYISAELVHKVMDNYNIVFADKKYFSELKSLKSIDNLDTKIFTLAPYRSSDQILESGRSQTHCGSNLVQDYFKNESGCNSDRRVWVHGNTSFTVSGYYYTPRALAECYGQLRNSLCNWKLYDNIWHTRNCTMTVALTMNGTTYSYPITMANYDSPGYEAQHIMYNGAVGAPVYWNGGAVPTIQFSAIHLEGSSQGVGHPNNWAIIACH